MVVVVHVKESKEKGGRLIATCADCVSGPFGAPGKRSE